MNDLWTATAQRAASEAKWLRPVVITLFVIGLIMIVKGVVVTGDACGAEVLAGEQRFSIECALREVGAKLVYAGPAIALLWALWETQVYLKRLEAGEVWAPATMKLFERIGEALIIAAVWAAIITPTLALWIQHEGGVQLDLEPQTVTLAGLGVALTAIARVLGEVLTAAAAAKADSDAIL